MTNVCIRNDMFKDPKLGESNFKEQDNQRNKNEAKELVTMTNSTSINFTVNQDQQFRTMSNELRKSIPGIYSSKICNGSGNHPAFQEKPLACQKYSSDKTSLTNQAKRNKPTPLSYKL